MARVVRILTTPIDGLTVVERRPHEDERGTLDRLFDSDLIDRLLPDFRVKQVNHTMTRWRGTVRGMHYQLPPYSDEKIVTCLRGRVFDVAVDVRRGSPTFLRWHGEVLQPGERRSLLLPAGLAHGFQALADNSELIYVHGAGYRPGAEAGLRPDDPAVGIDWPEPLRLMSERDATHPPVADCWEGVGE